MQILYELMEEPQKTSTKTKSSGIKRNAAKSRTSEFNGRTSEFGLAANQYQYARAGFLGLGEMNHNGRDGLPGMPVIQFTRDADIKKIMEVCENNRCPVDYNQAASILDTINANPGIEVRILNHNRTIQRYSNGTFHTRERHFTGVGTLGREIPGGAIAIVEDAPPVEEWFSSFTMDEVITKKNFAEVEKRINLNKMMGISASEQSGIPEAEYLHRKAHSLGGKDEPGNIIVGYHGLNTAMMPIESFVHNLVMCGMTVRYAVCIEPRVGGAIWGSTVNMFVSILDPAPDGDPLSYSIRISLNDASRIDSDSMDAIRAHLGSFAAAITERTGLKGLKIRG